MAQRVHTCTLSIPGAPHGQRPSCNHCRALTRVWFLRASLPHPRPRALFRVQFKGLPSTPRRLRREVLRLRPLRNVLSRFRYLRSSQCTLTPKVFLQVSIFSTAITPVVREPSQPVRDLPQVIPLLPPPKWSNASPGGYLPSAASSFKWRTNWPPPSPSKARFGAAPKLLQLPPAPASPL